MLVAQLARLQSIETDFGSLSASRNRDRSELLAPVQY